MLPENIIYIGVVINLVFTVWYIKTIFKDGTRPNPISWFVWTLAPFVGVFLQLKSGAGLSVLGTFMSGFGPFLVLVFSLFRKDAFWKINKFDVICGLTALFSIVLYIITNNLGISILFAILADLLAYLPTMIKTYKFPKTESASIYMGGIITNSLALLIIKDWSLAVYAFSVYLVLANLIEVALIYKKYFKKFKINS
jgi:hypothetical protein